MSHWETAGASDEWFTPAYVFEALGLVFDIDVAAPPYRTNVPCRSAIYANSLEATYPPGKLLWCNMPFGGRGAIAPWLDKFFDHGNGVALTPDRTSAPWFRDAWELADLALFTPKIRFIRPNGTAGKSPSNGTCLWAVGPIAVAALHRAKAAGLGILAVPA